MTRSPSATLVTPGPTATDAWLGTGGLAEQQGERDEVLAKVGAGRPLGRLAEPEEIASVGEPGELVVRNVRGLAVGHISVTLPKETAVLREDARA